MQLKMDEEAETFRKLTMRVLMMQLKSISVMDLVAYGGAALGIVVALLEFSKGNINFLGTFIIIMLSAEFFIPLRILGSYFHIAMNGMAASNKLFNILDIKEHNKGNLLIDNINIEFKNVNFSYEENRKVLNNINFKVKENDFISFVGKSGSGKSTIASLIFGSYINYEGNILIDNKEIKKINEFELMKNITIISHNSYIFSGTIKENLLMGNLNATKEELINVLKKVNLYDFIKTEGGLNMNILEQGVNLKKKSN